MLQTLLSNVLIIRPSQDRESLSPCSAPAGGQITKLIRVIFRLEGENFDQSRNYFFSLRCRLQLKTITMQCYNKNLLGPTADPRDTVWPPKGTKTSSIISRPHPHLQPPPAGASPARSSPWLQISRRFWWSPTLFFIISELRSNLCVRLCPANRILSLIKWHLSCARTGSNAPLLGKKALPQAGLLLPHVKGALQLPDQVPNTPQPLTAPAVG